MARRKASGLKMLGRAKPAFAVWRAWKEKILAAILQVSPEQARRVDWVSV